MKTLKDVQDYCNEKLIGLMKKVIENIDPYDEFNTSKLFLLRGKILAFEEIADELRNALDYHECQYLEYLNDGCVICGERKE